MAQNLSEELIKSLTAKANEPIVLRQFINNWELCKWDVEKWISIFGNKEIPFRCLKKSFISDEPCWERRCKTETMTFRTFIDGLATSKKWFYFDYKYVHQWFSDDSQLCQELSWKQFGYPDKGAADTSIWVGSNGAHTPAHQDTYGYNIVVQVHGRKRWIFFPPEAGGLKPARVPYEESSVYSQLNFYCPNDLTVFNGLTGCRMVELSAGDALVVPRGWWHYVQNLDPLNISLNIWLPHEKDKSAQVSEALIKIFVAQICKDLPQKTRNLLVNPNEDDISDTPLSVLFLQLDTVAKAYLDHKRKTRRAKRQRTHEDDGKSQEAPEIDIKFLLNNPENKFELVPNITTSGLIDLIRDNLKLYTSVDKLLDEDDLDGATSSLCLTKAVIDAFSQSNVIDVVKQNLFSRLK